MKINKKFYYLIFVLLFALVAVGIAQAATGYVDPINKWAWGTNVGWINFNPTDSQVTIDQVTGSFDGYAWGENIGWISFRGTGAVAYNVAVNFEPSELPDALPATGFTPGVLTTLPEQSVDKSYSSTAMMLDIPALGVNAPIVAVPLTEDGWEVAWLGQSAGYLEGTAFPTTAGNTGITAHVWDANNNPGPFAKLKNLRHGSVVKIHAWGYVYTYSVRYNYLTTLGNMTPLQHEDYDWVTLLTYERYSPTYDNYRFRRVVRAVLVDVSPE
jgi:LPXTG-site transpeptidase (sortase) family protein